MADCRLMSAMSSGLFVNNMEKSFSRLYAHRSSLLQTFRPNTIHDPNPCLSPNPNPNFSPNPNPNPKPSPKLSPKPSPNPKPYNEKLIYLCDDLLLTFCILDESNGRFNCTLCNFSGRGVWCLPLKQCCGNIIEDMQGNCYMFD